MKKRAFALALALVLLVTVLPVGARTARENEPVFSRNIHTGDGAAAPPDCFLFERRDGILTRVEYSGEDKKIYIEDYTTSFRFRSRLVLEPELPVWGGFYHGKKANYMFFGQENAEKNNMTEVVRVVKYDNNWKRLGAVSLYGGNTRKPFEGGAVRCAESGNVLYVRMGHEMYEGGQASMTLLINSVTMEIEEGHYGGGIDSFSYVNPSVGRQILVDHEKRVVMVDATSDALVLGRSRVPGGMTEQEYAAASLRRPTDGKGVMIGYELDSEKVVEFAPEGKACTLGSVVETAEGYLTAWSSDYSPNSGSPQVCVSFVGSESLGSKVCFSDSTGGTAPLLVPVSLYDGWILWNRKDDAGKPTDTLVYAKYNKYGTVTKLKIVEEAPLSDCEPLFYRGKLIWYVTNDSAPVFYVLDEKGLTRQETGETGGVVKEGISWSFDPVLGALTVEGMGMMDNYDVNRSQGAPWYGYRDQIRALAVSDGITRLGAQAFHSCGEMTSAALADSVTVIGDFCFTRCVALNRIVIPAGVTMIGKNAFYECGSLRDVYFGGTSEQWKKIVISAGNDALTLATIHCDYTPAPEPTVSAETGMAYASTQKVAVGSRSVEFQMYALLDENGNPTNYIKARDLAYILNGTKDQFGVGFDTVKKVVNLLPGEPYTANGSEMHAPFAGDRPYRRVEGTTLVDGKPSSLAAILLTSDSGGGFTYYKLRDLGSALGFTVGWSESKGVYIDTNLESPRVVVPDRD